MKERWKTARSRRWQTHNRDTPPKCPDRARSRQNNKNKKVMLVSPPKSSEIPPIQTDEGSHPHLKPNTNEISPKEPNEVTDLVAMEEGARVQMHDNGTYSDSRKECGPQSEENLQQTSPQIDTAQHHLDDNFSDVMRSSALGSKFIFQYYDL